MSVRAGGVDWVARWTELQAAAAPVGDDDTGDRWAARAARFDRFGRQHAAEGVDALREGLRPGDSVLDIGAGTGRHAVPLARHGVRVTALEPSRAMRERLSARAAEEGVDLSIVEDAWPCDTAPVDVAFSCHVLYGVRDAAAFVERMTRVARRSCKLLLGLRAPTDALAPLWRAVHGVERAPRPAALEALALLHQLGHDASLRPIAGSRRRLIFEPTDEDLDELCHRLRVDADAASRARIAAALDAAAPRASSCAAWDLGLGAGSALLEWAGAA